MVFSKRDKYDFSDAPKYLARTGTDFFAVFSRKHIKWAFLDILMPINLGVNITRQMSPFFSSTVWALYVDTFYFCISKT